MATIEISHARERNLKDISVSIPSPSLTLLSGKIGSGRSSLALTAISVPGSISIRWEDRISKDETILSHLGLASVMSNIVREHGLRKCPRCGGDVQDKTVQERVELLISNHEDSLAWCLAPVDPSSFDLLAKRGLTKLLGPEGLVDIDQAESSSGHYLVLIDRITVTSTNRERLREALDLGISIGEGVAVVRFGEARKISGDTHPIYFSGTAICVACGFQGEGSGTEATAIGEQPILKFDPCPPELKILNDAGLGHLRLNQPISTLAPEERLRVRLSKLLVEKTDKKLIYIEEPFSGFSDDHVRLTSPLLSYLQVSGNTVIVSSSRGHNGVPFDTEISLGPDRGDGGGTIIYAGKPKEIPFSSPAKITDTGRPSGTVLLEGMKVSSFNNDRLTINTGSLNILNGRDGSAIISTILIPIFEALRKKDRLAGEVDLAGIPIKSCKVNGEIGTLLHLPPPQDLPNLRSVVAQASGVLDGLRNFYSSLELSRMRGYSAESFSLSSGKRSKNLRCTRCCGTGIDPEGKRECDRCSGTLYEIETLSVKYKERAIGDILKLTVDEAEKILAPIPECAMKLSVLKEFKLGHIRLNRLVTNLSIGERRLLALAQVLAPRKTPGLFLLDNPTALLDSEAVDAVAKSINAHLKQGSTIVIASTDPLFIG